MNLLYFLNMLTFFGMNAKTLKYKKYILLHKLNNLYY